MPDLSATRATRTIRVVHVAEVIKGGICTYLREIVTLQRHSFGADRVVVIAPASQISELGLGSDVRIVGFKDSASRAFSAIRAAWATLRLIRHQPPDVVHIHSTFAGMVVRPLLALMRCKAAIVYCPHGWAFFRDLSPLRRSLVLRLERLCSHWCDAIVCVSRHERVCATRIGIGSGKLVVVQNGLRARQSPIAPIDLQWPAGARRVLFVGRFDRQKGVDVLFKALGELGDEAFAYILGDSLRASLGALPQNARYAGWATPAQLESYYDSAQVVVMPSRWEGFPLVAVEAMRAGLPVIATDVGGLPEIVDDGETGVLIPPNDAAALVRALRSTSLEQLQAMGAEAAKKFARTMTIEETHRRVSMLYQRLTRKTGRSAISWHADFARDQVIFSTGRPMLGKDTV